MPLVSISTATIIDVSDSRGAGFNMCNPRYCTFEEATLPPLFVFNGTASKSTTSLFGSQSLQLTANAPDCYAYLGASITDYNINITPNKKWIASFYVYSTVARAAGSVELYIKTSDGVHYNINGGAIAANEWTRISGVINLSANPSTKAIYRLDNNIDGTTALYDGVMFEAQIGSLETPSVFNELPNFLNTYTGDLSATRNVYKGAWVSGTAYKVGDIVMDSSNNGWTCLTANSATTSPVAGTNWGVYTVKGDNAITGGLTNPSQSVPTASDGTGANYTTASGVFEVYSGTTNITTLCTFSTSAAANGLTLAIVAGTGAYSLAGTSWISDIETFTLTATLPALYGSGTITKKYTISKSKAGATGITSDLIPIFYQNGINGATVAVPTGVPSGGSYIFSTNVLSSLPTGWSRTCPGASTTATYSVECRFSTTTPSLSIDATWTNLRLHTQTGTNGTSVYSASVYYQRGINGAIADTPGTPNGGSYNFSAATLTAPTGFWSISQPTTTTVPTWASDYTFNTTAGGTITAGTWSAPKVIAQMGESPAIFWWEDTIPIYYRNGDNGATVAVPTAPSGGSYNFVTKTFVSPDTKWTATRPSTITTNETYVSDYRFRTDTAGITVVATLWNNLAVCALKTTATGTSSYKATVYRLAGTAPGYPTGGTYNFSTNLLTAPDLWSTTQPLITEPNLFVYAVDFNFNAGSTTTQTATTWYNLRIDAQMGSAGSNGISASLTNDSFSLPLNTDGSISYVGSGTKLSLYDGATKLIYDGVGADAGKWKVVATGSNITASASISGSGTTEASIGDASGFLGTITASIDFEFTGRNAAGFPIKASKSQTFTKQQAGKEGPSVTVTASSVLAFTSTSGILNTKIGSVNPDITLTANTKNMTGTQTYAWSLTLTTGSIETTSTLLTASTQSITAATFGTAISAKVTCTVTYNSQTYKVDSYIYRNEKMNASTSGGTDPVPRLGVTGLANPPNPIKGDSYFQTVTNLLWVWTGSVWNKVFPELTSGNISTFMPGAAIGTAQIGLLAVETANIKDGNITNGKIGDGIASDNYSTVNNTGWEISKTRGITSYDSFTLKDSVGKVVLTSNGGVTGVGSAISNLQTGRNLLTNSGFVLGSANWFFVEGYNLTDWSLSTVQNTIYTSTTSPNTQSWVYSIIPAVVGQRYEFSGYTGAHRCTVSCYVEFLNSAGTQIATVGASDVNASQMYGGTALSGYKRLTGFATAPAGTVTARIVFERGVWSGIGDPRSFLFVCLPFFGTALPEQTTFSSWNEGASGATERITSGNASTYIADLAVDTLQIAGNAVTIPISATGAINYWGTGYYVKVCEATIVFSHAGSFQAIASWGNGYSSGIHDMDGYLQATKADGTIIGSGAVVHGGASFLTAATSTMFCQTVPIGTVLVQLWWKAHPTVQLSYSDIIVLGAKR